MYLEHFKLKKKPFEQLPDPEFLFLTDQHDEALSRMQFSLAIDDSFTVVTGEVGSGKTTLIRKLLGDMGEECRPVFVTHTRLTATELLQMILVELGLEPFDMGKPEMLLKLQRAVEAEREQGRRLVVVVDEAQNFEIDVLEELRLLTCMDTAKNKSVNIVLVGQPQLSETLQSPDLDQLRQRVRLRFHLDALSEEETVEYVKHRIRVAEGDPDKVFDELALLAIHEHTNGIPRLINTLCDTALIMAFVAKTGKVSIVAIDDALEELAWEEMSPVRGATTVDQLDIHATAQLVVNKRGKRCGEYVLNMPSYVIGRSDDCSIMIRSRYLSRHHALLARDTKGWIISDLRSTNGISVNGRDVKFARLTDRDIIGIGEYLIRFSVHKQRETERLPVEEKTALLNELPDLA